MRVNEMTHPSEEDMILYLYREGLDDDSMREHVEACPSCRQELGVLRGVLAQVAQAESLDSPERPDDYEDRVWARLSRKLPREHRDPRRPMRGSWGYLVAAAAVILVTSFLAGRFTAPEAPGSPDTSAPSQVREGVLLVALGDHLVESEVLLLEVANRSSGTTPLERERATELLQASRLYRQTASGLGEVATADVLEELERLLLDLSHGPDSAEAQAALRNRIEEHDLLFKLRVLEANLRTRRPRGEPGAVRKF
jgi:hypothetical protein